MSDDLPIVVGVSGASGTIFAVRMLQHLRELGRSVHLVVSESAVQTARAEVGMGLRELRALAQVSHSNRDIGAAVASGSFLTAGMIVVPCSIRSLSNIAYGNTDTLIARAADVTLKDRRRLVLMVRETPLHTGHLRAMLAASENGAVIMPPMPAFYHRPETIEQLVDQTVGRALDMLGVRNDLVQRWKSPADAIAVAG